jgi:hypothetical protein
VHCPLRSLGFLGRANQDPQVVWRVTPLFAEWIASPNFLFREACLTPDSVVLELGAGVSGVVALTLAAKIRRYIASDQDYALKLLTQNISENSLLEPPSASNTKKRQPAKSNRTRNTNAPAPSSKIETLVLDWETSSTRSLSLLLDNEHGQGGVDAVIACDCIYNDALIEPFVSCCAEICALRNPTAKPTVCIIAQQLRSSEVFESWLRRFHRSFHVWRVPEQLLTPSLKEDSGFVVHIGILR